MPKKKRTMSAATRKAMSEAKKKWWAQKKAKKPAAKAAPAAPAAAPARMHVPTKRSAMMPHGITVLRRNGKGKDILEGSADEIRTAVKVYRDLKKLLKA